jgi:gamma-glutamyltranspeptidase/glutathione hydrolase
MTTSETPRITGERYPSRRSVVMTTRGVVAASQPLAAQAGLRILMAGGNAPSQQPPP